jgi:hypothetical protein
MILINRKNIKVKIGLIYDYGKTKNGFSLKEYGFCLVLYKYTIMLVIAIRNNKK